MRRITLSHGSMVRHAISSYGLYQTVENISRTRSPVLVQRNDQTPRQIEPHVFFNTSALRRPLASNPGCPGAGLDASGRYRAFLQGKILPLGLYLHSRTIKVLPDSV